MYLPPTAIHVTYDVKGSPELKSSIPVPLRHLKYRSVSASHEKRGCSLSSMSPPSSVCEEQFYVEKLVHKDVVVNTMSARSPLLQDLISGNPASQAQFVASRG